MRDHLREKVTVAYPYGVIDPEFHASMLRLVMFDAQYGKRLRGREAIIGLKSTHIVMGRNRIVRAFLEECSSDWLLFIDTDQTFDPDIIERMVESADPVERPIVSALIMAMRESGQLTPACAVSDGSNLLVPKEIPGDRWWKVVPGCGCTIIHRSVLEAMRAEHDGKTAFPFFAYPDIEQPDGSWDTFGEDYTFMLRAIALGFVPVVDTTIEVGHVKTFTAHPSMFPGRHKNTPPATVAIIPFKDKWKMTRATAEGAQADLLLLMNNGSSHEATEAATRWAAANGAEVIDCKGLGIHEMWNAGAEVALERFPKVDIAFLNNDLELGEDCVEQLSHHLRRVGDEPLVAVCPNYDGRDGEGIEPLKGICANKYDGTGGLAGFCFMVKGEWFQTGWRFPEDAMWWYGDNLLTMSIDVAGGWYGMVHAATVKHLDGGGQTLGGNDYGDTPQGKADWAAFVKHAEALGYKLAAA